MHCAGKNCVMLSTSGYSCEVSPFHGDYQPLPSVEIVKAATAYDDPQGRPIYIVMNSALWFGSTLDHSLFNGLLARDAGIFLSVDPTDSPGMSNFPDSPVRVPLTRQGNKMGVHTYKPTRDEVLNAIALGGDNVIFLNADADYSPESTVASVTDHYGETCAVDPRPRLTDLPLDLEHVYGGAVSPHNEAPFFWQHQIHQVLTSKIRPEDGDNATSNVAQVLVKEGNESYPGLFLGTGDDQFPNLCLVAAEKRHQGPVNAEILHRQWGIGIQTARETMKVTTQLAIRHATNPLRRRYRTDLLSLAYRRFNTKVYMDIIFFKYESVHGDTCAAVFCTKEGFMSIYPLKSKSLAGTALDTFIQDVGVPNELICDNAPEMIGPNTEFAKHVRFWKIKMSTIEPNTPKQNYMEPVTGSLRKRLLYLYDEKGASPRLWSYATKWLAEIRSRTYRESTGRTGLESLTGDTPDISEYTDFSFYDRVWFWHTPSTQEPAQVARWLGVSHRVGSSLCYYVLTENGDILSRTTVQNVTRLELAVEANAQRFQQLDEGIKTKLNDENHVIPPVAGLLYVEDEPDPVADAMNPDGHFLPDVDEWVNDGGDDDGYDEYVGSSMNFNLGGNDELRGVVVKRARGEDGSLIGTRDNNPLLDTRRYLVRFIDGSHQELAANIIAENLYSQVNEEGHMQVLFKEIDGIRRVKAPQSKRYRSLGGNLHRPKTTAGWEVHIKWRDGASSWLPMVEVKDSNPIELAEYVTAHGLADEEAFAWWVPHALRCRRRMVSKVKSKYWRTTHKFGIEIPKSVETAYDIDRATRSEYWHKAVEKEMKKIRAAMQVYDGTLDDAKKKLVGYQQIRCHMVFDIKMEGLVRKARFVAGGHTTDAPKSLTYASVVTRESVRLAFLVAALNDLNILAADVSNAYLNADCREKIFFVAGEEFGSLKGKVLIIKKALYGLKSSGAAWRALFASTLHDMGFKTSRADPDVWIKPNVKPDGHKYYEMILVYVDDILHVSHYPDYEHDPAMQEIGRIYELKDGSVKEPTYYLGANIGYAYDEHGVKIWYMSASDYIDAAVKTVQSNLPSGTKLRGKADRPYHQDYKPELDATPFLDEDGISQYQGYIGILRWLVEIGRVDIMTEVSLLSSYLVAPRDGHLHAALSIFAYLNTHKDHVMFFNPMYYDVNESDFPPMDQWQDLYGDISEEVPPDAPEPRGFPIVLTALCDASHASNKVTRRSQSGFVIYGNCAPLIWFSKKQATIETSTFGSEFVALRLCIESVIALRYKLRMFGIPVVGPSNVYCDNGSVVNCTAHVEGRLTKKHLSICYHRVRECCAQGICRIAKIAGEANVADLFTKILGTPRRTELIQQLLRHFRSKPAHDP